MGIHYFIFVSAAILGLGMLTVISAKSIYKIIAGIAVVFSASLINIASFTGFWGFNPEGQIILTFTILFCILNIAAGIILLGYRKQKKFIFSAGIKNTDD